MSVDLSVKEPYLFEGLNVQHWLAEKAKVYGRLADGFPERFDQMRVEYAEPEYGWMDTAFYVNGEKKIVVPLSDTYNPLQDIVKWLERIVDGDSDLNEHYVRLDCERGCQAILHYERLNAIGEEYGLFFVYGSWTDALESGEDTLSAVCTLHDLVDTIYTPQIKLWEGYLETKCYDSSGEEYYHWHLPSGDMNSPQELLKMIRSGKIEYYLSHPAL